MKTIKELKKFLKDLPDDMPLLVRFELNYANWTYFQNVDMEVQPMRKKERSDEWEYNSAGQPSLVIF